MPFLVFINLSSLICYFEVRLRSFISRFLEEYHASMQVFGLLHGPLNQVWIAIQSTTLLEPSKFLKMAKNI